MQNLPVLDYALVAPEALAVPPRVDPVHASPHPKSHSQPPMTAASSPNAAPPAASVIDSEDKFPVAIVAAACFAVGFILLALIAGTIVCRQRLAADAKMDSLKLSEALSRRTSRASGALAGVSHYSSGMTQV
jgi:hypothetical protein